MIPPVERAIQKMMDSHFKPGMPPFGHPLSVFQTSTSSKEDARHKNTNTDYCEAVLSHSVIICQGVTRDGNPYPF